MSGGIVSNSDIPTTARKLLNPPNFEVMRADAIREGDRHFFGRKFTKAITAVGGMAVAAVVVITLVPAHTEAATTPPNADQQQQQDLRSLLLPDLTPQPPAPRGWDDYLRLLPHTSPPPPAPQNLDDKLRSLVAPLDHPDNEKESSK
jgi:hypothetical protein